MGQTTRLHVTITNRTQEGRPMTLARVGIPGGLQFQTWQLQELREKGLIAFYESQAREVCLYLRQLTPAEVVKVPIDLVAAVPGEFTAPASSAYLSYTDEHKTWVDGVKVKIEPRAAAPDALFKEAKRLGHGDWLADGPVEEPRRLAEGFVLLTGPG